MKLNTFAPRKSRAQAMVEFAIVLPLLLLLLYGLLETGRLLFMYSTIVTATRQAVRYGSATGIGSDGLHFRFQDCAGIRQAAQRVDFLNSFDDVDIFIYHDSGPGSGQTPYCGGDPVADPPPAFDTYQPVGNNDRLVVKIEGDFQPVVPRIVPFISRSNNNTPPNPIIGISARTILTGVAIEVTPPPGAPGGPGPSPSALVLTMSATPTTYAFEGEIINFSYTLTNNGTVEISGLTFAPTHGAMSCPGTTLAAGASMTCSGAYQITAADITAASVTAQATATGTDGTNTVPSNTATVTLTFTVVPRLQLAKAASTEYATTGGAITYTFTLTNTGNVPLTSSTVSDPMIGNPIPGCGGDLAVGASTTCTATYTVSNQDVNNNPLVNTATASALYGTQTVTSDPASATVWTGPLFLRASVSPTSVSAPTTVTYSYELINNTGLPLYPPYSISGYRGSENCSTNTSSIPVGGSITCTGTYDVTQSDLDTRSSLNNADISATGCTNDQSCSGQNRVTSNTRSVSITLVRNPGLSLTIFGAGPNPVTTLGTDVVYTYTVSNTGNVTLSSIVYTDTKAININCPATLAPGAVQNCTGTHTVTQADLDAGSIWNQATATTMFASQTVSASSQIVSVITFPGPRLKVQITPNPTSFTGVAQFIVYTYTLTNTGGVDLYGPYTISDNKVTIVDCLPATSPLTVGNSTSCVGSYATTQADVDAGNVINSASATASDGIQVITSNSAMAVVYVPGAPTLTPSATSIGAATATPTATGTPGVNLKVQLQDNGNDDQQMSEFSFRVQNLGTAGASSVSVRIYFTLDGSHPVSDYRLQRLSGDAASISAPTLVSGTTYYYTVSRATDLAAGGTWTVNLRLDLNRGPNNFDSGNDWWHNGAGALPGSFSDWLRIPAYVSGSRVWGNEPP